MGIELLKVYLLLATYRIGGDTVVRGVYARKENAEQEMKQLKEEKAGQDSMMSIYDDFQIIERDVRDMERTDEGAYRYGTRSLFGGK